MALATLLVRTDLEKHYESFESSSVDELIKHGLKALRFVSLSYTSSTTKQCLEYTTHAEHCAAVDAP
jgi:hypothetical protein